MATPDDAGITGIWLWRSMIGAAMVLATGAIIRGCEFRDQTVERLTRIEERYDNMLKMDEGQNTRMNGIDARIDRLREDVNANTMAIQRANDRAKDRGNDNPDGDIWPRTRHE